MHHLIRLSIAATISAVTSWLSFALSHNLYTLTTGEQPPTASDFTILSLTISLIIGGIVFVISYLKITSWLGE